MNETEKKDDQKGKLPAVDPTENVQLVDMPPSGAVEIRVSIKANPVSANEADRASPKLYLREVELSSKSPSGQALENGIQLPKSPKRRVMKKHWGSASASVDRTSKSSQSPSTRHKRSRRMRFVKATHTEPGGQELEIPEEMLINKPEVMALSCGVRCIKWAVFTFNFVIFVLGITLFGTSLYVLLSDAFKNYLQELIGKTAGEVDFNQFTIVIYVVAAVGALLAVCGFLGCCGACCENRCLLGTFFTIMLVLFVVTVVGAVYILAKKDEFHHFIADLLKKYGVDRYYSDPEAKNLMDKMQKDLSCCGSRGCSDYASPPDSCGCGAGFVQGCADYFHKILINQTQTIAGILFGTLALELLAMLFSCMLFQGIGRYV